MKKTISLVVVLVLAITATVATADFTFGEPTNLGPTVNSQYEDYGTSISNDGLSHYFTSNRPGSSNGRDLWVTKRTTVSEPWGQPMNVGQIVNDTAWDSCPNISADGLSLFFESERPGGSGNNDIWVTTRETTEDGWSNPVNLGSTVNSWAWDSCPSISRDGLSLYFTSYRPGGYGNADLWVTTRATVSDPWIQPMNLGPNVNSSATDFHQGISSDGLCMFFFSNRSGGYGNNDLLVTTRASTSKPWRKAVNLGPLINSSANEIAPEISTDGFTLYFSSNRTGGQGFLDIWQTPIIPIVDLNDDGIVDADDMCIIVDHWGTDEALCDIGPMPWGDGIVDVQDLIILAEHLFEEFPPIE